MSPIPPAVSATVTIRAPTVGRLQPPASMKPAVVLKSKALISPAWIIAAPTPMRRISRPRSAAAWWLGWFRWSPCRRA